MNFYSKQILALAIFAFMLSLFFYPDSLLSLEEEPKKDTKEITIKYAALQAAKQVIKEWENRDIPGIVRECTDLNFKNENKKRNNCETNLEKYFTERLEREIKNDLETVARSFQGPKGSLLFKEMKEKFKSSINKSIVANVSNKYQGIFKRARDSAIGRQLQKLTINIYPDEDTSNINKFESVYLKGWLPTDVQRLESVLRGKIEKKEELLEEVEKLKEKIISEVLKDIKQQMEIQKAAVSRELPDTLKTRKQLKEEMIRAIDASKLKNEKKTMLTITYKDGEIEVSKAIKRKVYGIFRFIREIVEARANEIERSRFYDFCKTTDTIKVWNKQELNSIITQNLEAHKKNTKSKAIIFKVFFPRAVKTIVESFSTNVPLPEKNAFRNRLEMYLDEMEGEIKIRIDQLLGEDLDEVREQVAEEQLRRFFPKIANNSWEVPRLAGEKDESRVDIMKRIKVSMKYRLSIDDTSKCFQNPIFEEIKYGSIDNTRLLDNTEKKVLQKVRSLIYEEAGQAWDEQLRIYEDQKKSISNKEAVSQFLKCCPTENEMDINKERLVSYFRERIKEMWRHERLKIIETGNISEYGAPKYYVLFEYFEKEIDRILDQSEGTELLEAIIIRIKEIKREKQQKKEAIPIKGKNKSDSFNTGIKNKKSKGKNGSDKGPGGTKEELSKKKKTVFTTRKFSLLSLLLLCLLIILILVLLICCLRNRKK